MTINKDIREKLANYVINNTSLISKNLLNLLLKIGKIIQNNKRE